MATVAPTGDGQQPAVEKRNGGTLVHAGNVAADSPITQNKSIADLADDQGQSFGSKVIAKEDGGLYSDRTGFIKADGTSVTGGVTELGYKAGRDEWVVMGGNVTTTLAGSAYSGLAGGAAGPNPTRDFVAQLETTRDYGDIDIDIFAVPSSGFNGYVTKTGGGAEVEFIDPAIAGGATASTDAAANTTRAVPGELTYMFGGKLPKQDNYKAKDSAES